MGRHSESFIQDVRIILDANEGLHTREIYNKLFDLGKRNKPSYGQLVQLLPARFELVKEESDKRLRKTRYWRNRNVMD
tara:strand:- start:8 stop:241 length:234 start_codon:yes stop_codon:yes gene_type:complete